jgi:hypothetical protein
VSGHGCYSSTGEAEAGGVCVRASLSFHRKTVSKNQKDNKETKQTNKTQEKTETQTLCN